VTSESLIVASLASAFARYATSDQPTNTIVTAISVVIQILLIVAQILRREMEDAGK
jgi:hypothetical protein